MQALRLPAARGWYWIADGFRLLRRNPPLLTFLVFGYFLLLLILDLMPVIGTAIAGICVPPLSMGVMNGCRAIDRNETVRLNMLLSGFQRNGRALVAIGGMYFALTVAILMFSALIDDGELMRVMRTGRGLDGQALDNSQLMLAMQTVLLLLVPFMMAFWFAPFLAAWNDCPPMKALFFSFVACWRNWRAFLVYGLATAGISVLAPGALLAVVGLLTQSPPRFLAAMLSLPLMFIFVPTMFASFYVSYRDIFSTAPDHAPAS